MPAKISTISTSGDKIFLNSAFAIDQLYYPFVKGKQRKSITRLAQKACYCLIKIGGKHQTKIQTIR